MTVFQDGYICAVCGPVTAKLWWSREEDDLVASCTKCGHLIQRVIAVPFSTLPLGGGGYKVVSSDGNTEQGGSASHPALNPPVTDKGPGLNHSSNPTGAPTPPQEDTA